MAAQVNGEAPSSAFLNVGLLFSSLSLSAPLLTTYQHLVSYPLISDSITTFKTNPYGAKSLSLTSSSLARLQPLLPYISKPLSYVHPYITRADSLGDSTLSSLESRFPVVKKPTGELYAEGKDIVFFPLKKGTEGKEYVLGVWGSEKKKTDQEGIVGLGKAMIATGLVVSGEAYRVVSEYLVGAAKTVKKEAHEKTES